MQIRTAQPQTVVCRVWCFTRSVSLERPLSFSAWECWHAGAPARCTLSNYNVLEKKVSPRHSADHWQGTCPGTGFSMYTPHQIPIQGVFSLVGWIFWFCFLLFCLFFLPLTLVSGRNESILPSVFTRPYIVLDMQLRLVAACIPFCFSSDIWGFCLWTKLILFTGVSPKFFVVLCSCCLFV